MAHFGLENDIGDTLKVDVPVTNGPIARWQRKASLSNALSSGLSPVKYANTSVNTTKTPGRTPGIPHVTAEFLSCGADVTRIGRRKATPSKMMGEDRFIPVRNEKQMEVASFLLSKEFRPKEDGVSTASTEQQKMWSMMLNGCNVEEARILQFSGKPTVNPDGQHNSLKSVYSHTVTPMSNKKTRYIASTSEKILDAPDVRDDFYLNLLDWNSSNIMAVGLSDCVYLWDATQGNITHLLTLDNEADYITSLSWAKEGSYLAVGTSDCAVQVWDVSQEKCLRSMNSHSARVCSLSWNGHILSSGSHSGQIHHHDVRVAEHHIFTLRGHSQEVCGLQWSPDGRYLASGGNDNLVCIWPHVGQGRTNVTQPLRTLSLHKGAVKALAWCPWQSSILASGGGTSDCHIRVWNVNSGSCLSSLDTQSQVSALVFVPNYKELVSAHGFTRHNLVIWKYPSMAKVTELNGHSERVLNMAISPDGSVVASLAADETIRLWKSFEVDPKQKAKDKTPLSLNSAFTRAIR
ncbi:cell division cycle protein 20 homolog isoform X1 [Syngnathus acus]|uniref:cell division cycle protein 20 homolog isoform X1 n=1 Tax=Syngnathus acus TaxID=161584 RepID=UPI001885ABB8|nr:cell division cycle protein 20 homolog isoform X1 [Syngnathus acus]